MLGWVVTFLIIALIAGVLGFGGIAGASIEIAKDHLLHRARAVPGLGPGPRRARQKDLAGPGRHAHLAAKTLRPRNGGMGVDDGLDAGADVGRERRDLARRHVDMHGHVLRCRR